MGKFNLTEAAKEILDASVTSKRAGQDAPRKLDTSVAYGTKDAGKIGDSPEDLDDTNPDYTKGTPSATPPGATPPVGKQTDGVGASKPANQPGDSQGRGDLKSVNQADANNYEQIRDRKKSTLAPQTMQKNPGATFDTYGEEIDMSDDVNALLEGESLSDEFKNKATTIFEAAVMSRVQAIAEQIEVKLTEQFDEAVEIVKEELAEKVDDYLNYMVEEWMKDNELAIEKGLRAEIVEEFIEKLRNVFVESYIDIPEEKVNVVEELADQVEQLEDALNEQIQKNIEQQKQINEHKKIEAIHTVCEGLTQTQVEKIKTLAENVDFTTEKEFEQKLATIKESYFPSQVRSATQSDLNEEVQYGDEEETKVKSSDPMMNVYAQAISKSAKK